MLIRFRKQTSRRYVISVQQPAFTVQREGIHAVFLHRTEQSRIDFHQVLNSARKPHKQGNIQRFH